MVALWVIPDLATEQLMSRFYKHLVEGESASESLHQTMKWTRKNGLNKMSEYASSTLIGDDVKLEFAMQRRDLMRTDISKIKVNLGVKVAMTYWSLTVGGDPLLT